MDVLVYLDPSPRGEWALAVAAQLPPSWRGTLRLLATAEDAAADPGLVERARARLSAWPIEAVTRPGPAERAVIEEARARPCGLLVVPPAGRGAIARMLKGSRVATVVRLARAPVLVARRPPERVTRVLGALSGRGTTAGVVEAALAWEEPGAGARASFVHVQSEVPLPLGAEGAAPETPGASEVEAARVALAARGREADLQLRDGMVVEEALDVFEAGAFHLLVVGAHAEGSPGFGREDLTERLLLGCPGSTLIVPR